MTENATPETLNASMKKYIVPVVFFAAILAVSIFMGVRYFNMHNGQAESAKAQNQNQKIVVMNVSKLIAAYTKQIMDDKALTPEQANELSGKIATNLQKVVIYYRDHGYIVLNGSNVVTWPSSIDITKTTADELGIKL